MARHPVDKASSLRGGPNQQLCERCRPWDDLVSISSGNNPLRLGYPIAGSVDAALQSMLSNTHCLICQALSAAIRTRLAHEKRTNPRLDTQDVLVRNYGPFFLHSGYHEPSSPENGSGSWMIDWSDPTCTRLRAIIKLDIFCSTGDLLMPFFMTPQFCLRHARTKPTTLVGVDPWEVPYFDSALLRAWIDTCDGIHGHEQASHDAGIGPLPPDFRVIDVERMKVTRPVNARGFVALSYMWQDSGAGDAHEQLTKANRARLESEGGLGSVRIPAIIADAIALCRGLGERYLWVDRFCIVQDDAGSKHGQIGAMDAIFSSASFTIMAALDARDGSSGLPGCPGRPRVSSALLPPRLCEGNRRGIVPVALRQVVDVCEWNRRGWTFQERLLSRRRLFITEFQVIFQCSCGTAYEELAYLPRHPDVRTLGDVQGTYPEDVQTVEVREMMEKRRQHRFQLPGFEDLFNLDSRAVGERHSVNLREFIGPSDLESYFENVKKYTARHLTFASDILNAYAGVANAIGRGLRTRMLFGLPERHLAQSLMWSRAQAGSRPRQDDNVADMPYIPSWSWASSAGCPADYLWSDDQRPSMKLEFVVSLVYLYIHDPDVGLRMLEQEERWCAHERLPIEEVARRETVPPATLGHEPDTLVSTEIWSACPHNPRQAVAHRALDPGACAAAARFPGALVFNTTVADLWVEAPRSGDAMGSIVAPGAGEVVGRLSSGSAGWVAARNGRQRAACRFVVLSGGLSDYELSSKSSRVRRQCKWRLHVMLVEPVPGEPHVVRRVEVGYIYTELWKICEPRWETVVLF